MNAHINIDLALTVVEVCDHNSLELDLIKEDFMKIFEILEIGVNQVQKEINRLSPFLWIIDVFGGRSDEVIMSFSIKMARNKSWALANHINKMNENERIQYMENYSNSIIQLGKKISNPGIFIKPFIFIIKLLEEKKLERVINNLIKDPISVLPNIN